MTRLSYIRYTLCTYHEERTQLQAFRLLFIVLPGWLRAVHQIRGIAVMMQCNAMRYIDSVDNDASGIMETNNAGKCSRKRPSPHVSFYRNTV